MTPEELKSSVAALNAETTLDTVIDDPAVFTRALDRALLELNRIRPRILSATLAHYPPTPALWEHKLTTIAGGDSITLEPLSDVTAIALEVGGAGTLTLHRDDINVPDASVSWNNGPRIGPLRKLMSAFFPGIDSADVTITLTATQMTYVRNITVYDTPVAASADEIPIMNDYCEYSLAAICPDFLRLLDSPLKYEGVTPVPDRDWRIRKNGTLLLPLDRPGVYEIEYYAQPHFAVDGEDIEVDPDLTDILALYCAAYVYIDAAPDAAQYFLNRAREAASLVIVEPRLSDGNRIITNGW